MTTLSIPSHFLPKPFHDTVEVEDWVTIAKRYLQRHSMAVLEVQLYPNRMDLDNLTEHDFMTYRDWKIDHDTYVRDVFDSYDREEKTRHCSPVLLQYYFDMVEHQLLEDFYEFIRLLRLSA